jgi:hypothetical protein
MPFSYPKIIVAWAGVLAITLLQCNHRPINCRETALPICVNLRLQPLRNLVFILV